ncbi:MAG: alkaline phosphatase family protein [Ferruginibacter sp.]
MLIFPSGAGAQQSKENRVVMISLDGTPDFLVDRFLKNGVLPADGAFARMKREGAVAKTVLPINVASTGPSHISIFTGAAPGITSIVGNSFRSKKQPWDEPALTAFRQPYTAENIFRAAMRQGKQVIALGGVGIDYQDSSRMTTKMLMYPSIAGPSSIVNLNAGNEKFIQNGDTFTRLLPEIPAAGVQLGGGKKTRLWFYLKDTVTEEANILKPSFKLILDTDSLPGNGYAAALNETGWQVLRITANDKVYNLSATLFHASPAAGKFRLYLAPAAEVYGYPQSFMDRMQSACGLWPGEPDNLKETSGAVSEEIWFEQVGRLAAYSKNLILNGMKEEKWDLLFGYFSTLDDVQHRYTLTDKRQLDYTAENGHRPERYARIIEKWFRTIDGYLLEIMNAAPKGTSFVLFSDHGMLPVHSVLLLNNYLEQSGFYFSKKEIQAVVSGNSAHIYINPEKINGPDYAAYASRLKTLLREYRNPENGERIFELVADSNAQKESGLFHPSYSGDLFVSCKKGYSLSGRFLPGVPPLVKNSFDPSMFSSQQEATRNFLVNGTMNETGRAVHGCLGRIREGQSIFYAWGPDVPAKKIKTIRSVQIAATVSKLLHIDPPAQALNKPVF